MKQERFEIRCYDKSELAMLYFPYSSKASAMKRFRNWLKVSPLLRGMVVRNKRAYTTKEVKMIVEVLGEPFDTE